MPTAYFTTQRVSQHIEGEDCPRCKRRTTHRQSPPRHVKSPEGSPISPARLGRLQPPPLLCSSRELRENNPPPSPPPPPARTCGWTRRSLPSPHIPGPFCSPRPFHNPGGGTDPPPQTQSPPLPASRTRPSPHPALRRQLRATARLNRPPARTALRMRSPLPGMLTDGGGRAKREAAARGCPPRLASPHLASARLSHHAAGGRVSPGAVPPAPAPRLRSAGAPGTGRGVAGGRRRAPV